MAVLAELTGEDAPERDDAAADALGLLALVAGQDVEPAGDSDGLDGRWRIAGKVAHDRVISTVDVETRHTRKSKSNRRDGFRGHVAAEPETALITDCELTKACGEASSDPVVGEAMIARDRYHETPADEPHDAETVAAPHHAAEPADRRRNDVDAGAQGQGSGLKLYADSAYGTGEARAAYRAAGHDTVINPNRCARRSRADSLSTTSPSTNRRRPSPARVDTPGS